MKPGFRIGLILLIAALLWGWLFLKAESVQPETHADYLRVLRELRNTDNTINAQLLASRLELVRNYDVLTQLASQTVELGNQAMNVPDYVEGDARMAVLESVQEVQKLIRSKAQLIDLFKREYAISRNSLAYFPVAGDALLNQVSGVTRENLSRYLTDMLNYSRSMDAELSQHALVHRKFLDLVAHGPGANSSSNQQLANLLLHGDAIQTHLPKVERLTRQIINLPTGPQIDALSYKYSDGRAAAAKDASRYRSLLYLLSLLVSFYLVYTFVRLHRAQTALALANREIGERLAAQQKAEASLHLHASAFQNAHEGITLTDAQGNILDVNPAFSRITGWSREEVIGKNPRMLRSNRQPSAFYRAMWDTILRDGSWKGEIWNVNRAGESYPELLSINCVRDANGQPTNYVGVFSDISELKAQESKLAQMAFYDPLTGLPNRSLLADRMRKSMAEVQRAKDKMLAICFLDLDQFKPINDSWGHEVGDLVLIAMAGRLGGCLRASDTVARFGGDEFVLLMHVENANECVQAVARVLNSIAQPLQVAPHPVSLSASIGVTLFPDDGVDPDTLLRHADQAMYQAKQSGKNRFCLFDPEKDRQIALNRDLLDRLKLALQNDELVLHYQPKVNLATGEVVGAEALIRWQHPEQGLQAPGTFLYRLDGTELEIEFGKWVLETALQQMSRWMQAGDARPVSVNISANHLLHPDFVNDLRSLLARYPAVPAANLELEILESTSLANMDLAASNLAACHEIGVRIALDDFGTGYSTLTYFRNLAVDTIKIDQSFVRDMLRDPNDLEIVESIVKLATAFNREAIAEGVETLEHGVLLLRLGCPLCQGYGIAHPMPPALWPQWLDQWAEKSVWLNLPAAA